jgi:hypothetical protein
VKVALTDRRHTPQAELGVSSLTVVRALFSGDVLYEYEAVVPVPNRDLGGRPRVYPDYLVIAVGVLNDEYRSARKTFTELRDPVIWSLIRELVANRFPARRDKHLPEKAPRRTWWVRRRKWIRQHAQAELDEAHRRIAAAIRQEILENSPSPRGTRSRPEPADFVYADGKVITPLLKQPAGSTRDVEYLDTETGEITVEERPVRVDPDAKTHTVGDGTQVHGSKFLHIDWRGNRPHERVILDAAYVPGVRDEANSEADVLLRELKSLPPLPGILGVLTDGVLRGVHIDELQRSLGWLVVSPVTAAQVTKNKRIEKEGPLDIVRFDYDDGSSEIVELWYRGGGVCQRVVTGDGDVVLDPLERLETQIRHNRDGTYRSYVVYRVPNPRGGAPKEIRLRTYTNVEDRAAGFNRSENVRQIPPGDPSYEAVYGRREDAESINRAIDDHGYLQRARSVGAETQLFDLLCHAIRTNLIAQHLYGREANARAPAA